MCVHSINPLTDSRVKFLSIGSYWSSMVREMSLPGGINLSVEHAVFIEEESILAIADLHLGHEASLQAEHIAIPRFQLETMMPRLENLIERYEPEKLLINGDLKHEFSRNMEQEWDEVRQIVDFLADKAELVIIRGNHDNYLKTILSGMGIEMYDSYRTSDGRIEFVHGHNSTPSSEELRIYGHEHPFIRLRDEIGALISLPCFLFDGKNNFLLMPAFSPLASGTNVLSPVDSFMIEELRGHDISLARVYAIGTEGILDFGELGKLVSLYKSEGERKSNNRRNPCQTGEHG